MLPARRTVQVRRKRAQRLSTNIGLPAGYHLLKSRYGDEYRLVTTDDGKPYTAYAVKLTFHKEITFPHGAATQVMVWRTPRLSISG
jgi:hypothetical protein